MFEPVRGGTRGGQAEFKWSDVAQDKDRENYLGHSLNAPTGRWQKNKDIHWYQRETSQEEQDRLDEIKAVKEREAEALAAALGFAAGPKPGGSSNITSGANAVPVGGAVPDVEDLDPDASRQKALEKEERKRRKAERKEEKRIKKEKKRAERRHRHRTHSPSPSPSRSRSRSRSASPPRRRHDDGLSPRSRHRGTSASRHRSRYRDRERSMSRSPRRNRDREYPSRPSDYDFEERKRERERDRRRWDDNARRDRPGAYRGRN